MDSALDPLAVVFAIVATTGAATMGLTVFADLRRRSREARREVNLTRAALMRDLSRSIATQTSRPPRTDPEVLKQLELLEARLEQVEGRLPATDTLDKIASVNYAILATKHEETERAIARLDREAMSAGKVTAVVFTVLAAMFALVAAVPWIISQF